MALKIREVENIVVSRINRWICCVSEEDESTSAMVPAQQTSNNNDACTIEKANLTMGGGEDAYDSAVNLIPIQTSESEIRASQPHTVFLFS